MMEPSQQISHSTASDTGVVLMAFGRPQYYWAAYNLAYSIKRFNKSIQIACLVESKEDVDFALKTLDGKNPFADVAIESGITAQFSFVRIKPWILRFRVYGEALKGEPPTVLEF